MAYFFFFFSKKVCIWADLDILCGRACGIPLPGASWICRVWKHRRVNVEIMAFVKVVVGKGGLRGHSVHESGCPTDAIVAMRVTARAVVQVLLMDKARADKGAVGRGFLLFVYSFKRQ